MVSWHEPKRKQHHVMEYVVAYAAWVVAGLIAIAIERWGW